MAKRFVVAIRRRGDRAELFDTVERVTDEGASSVDETGLYAPTLPSAEASDVVSQEDDVQ